MGSERLSGRGAAKSGWPNPSTWARSSRGSTGVLTGIDSGPQSVSRPIKAFQASAAHRVTHQAASSRVALGKVVRLGGSHHEAAALGGMLPSAGG
ncbi:hypothetical protein GUJ93_ZPchr0004g39531 [Zizania palustris]|uniref:Uncharacterized protein n=1 Tax=Zizania palustris TaxID=103762 RepID=A0A8J5SF56_ZIZPA|nr:hypothetical protein GUJ93_ZPchr0004g39531 [Zizania palustris]